MAMQSAFYIVQTKPDWYRLHVTKTHYCIGAGGDLNTLLSVVYKYTRSFRTEDNMIKRLSELIYGKPSVTTTKAYENDYRISGHKFDCLIKGIVEKAERDNKETSKSRRCARRFMRRA